MAIFKEIKGSIFDSKCQVIVNTVNCKGFMGRGIALEYKYRFPEMYEEYKDRCEANQIRPGHLTLWQESSPWILNFPTKNDWKHPSKIEYIETGLEFFIKNYQKWKIQSIAFPRLGSSHGKLKWTDVREVLYHALKDQDLLVEVYEFDPNYKDKLFLSLLHKLEGMTLPEYSKTINLGNREAEKLFDKVSKGKIKGFRDIQMIQGIGGKSLSKIYEFAAKQSVEKQSTLTG